MTIIIPCYNQAQYLPDAIESALRQTVKCEIIVVDDGSTDGSLEIAKGYPVKVISQVNKGLASARNTGIMNTAEEFILFLDADDILMDNCAARILSTEGDIIAPSFKEFGMSNGTVILMADPKLEDFKVGNRIGYCAAIRRDALLAVGGYSPRMTFGYEDLHLTINLLTRGYKIVTIPEVLWLYRTKQGSMIQTAKAHHVELLNQINKDFKTELNF